MGRPPHVGHAHCLLSGRTLRSCLPQICERRPPDAAAGPGRAVPGAALPAGPLRRPHTPAGAGRPSPVSQDAALQKAQEDARSPAQLTVLGHPRNASACRQGSVCAPPKGLPLLRCVCGVMALDVTLLSGAVALDVILLSGAVAGRCASAPRQPGWLCVLLASGRSQPCLGLEMLGRLALDACAGCPGARQCGRAAGIQQPGRLCIQPARHPLQAALRQGCLILAAQHIPGPGAASLHTCQLHAVARLPACARELPRCRLPGNSCICLVKLPTLHDTHKQAPRLTAQADCWACWPARTASQWTTLALRPPLRHFAQACTDSPPAYFVQDLRISRGDGGSIFVMVRDVAAAFQAATEEPQLMLPAGGQSAAAA